MRYFFLVSEGGLLLVYEKKETVLGLPFDSGDRAKGYLEVSSGTFSQEQTDWLRSKVTSDDLIFAEEQYLRPLSSLGIKVETVSENDRGEISTRKIELIVLGKLAPSAINAEEMIRDVSLAISNLRIKELSAKPDLQAMEAVQALDEVDKTANIFSSRIREWYGLHFPELTSIVDDNPSLIKLILSFRLRANYDENELEQLGYSKAKSKAIASAAKESRGADLREEDLTRIVQLCEEAQHLFSTRDKLAGHVEKTMRQVAPNVCEIAGATIGARLIARAGGLEKLAILPASTIQILGAEKALYRALKTGARPPKHGVLFQHPAVHSAPKWQRGKIARSVAAKIAIAARIDEFRGTKDDTIEKSLNQRLQQIKTKYMEPPKPRPFARRPQMDNSPREFRGPKRERYVNKRRQRKPDDRDYQRKGR